MVRYIVLSEQAIIAKMQFSELFNREIRQLQRAQPNHNNAYDCYHGAEMFLDYVLIEGFLSIKHFKYSHLHQN